MTKVKTVFYLLTGFMLLTSFAYAQNKDVKGSKDHPLISRFNDSTIKHYEAKNFDVYILPLGTFVEGRKKTMENNKKSAKIIENSEKGMGSEEREWGQVYL